jgi:2-polyprenyl-3-methyl-5-hydroxy-6-metoxy-1,4-benzoquinol methylase
MHKCKNYIDCDGKSVSLYSQDQELKFEKCNECGIIWRSLDSWHFTKQYDETYFNSKNYSKRRKHKVKKSGWLIDIAKTNHQNIEYLLEIGCSIGYTLEAAEKRDIKYLGVDISDYAVEYCNSIGLNASKLTFADLKKNRIKYDLIFMQHVLEHFENPFKVLNDCNELLDKNGLVLIQVPNSMYKRAVKKKSNHRFYSINGVGAEHFVYFNYQNLKNSLKATGFEVIQENYPLFTNNDSLEFFVNRIFRRILSLLQNDQELFVIAKKIAS